MEKLSIEEIKKLELGILEWFDAVCKKNNIVFCLSGGTLLGAVRHHGFIPWDDDIDLMMTRPEYDKLISLMNNLEMGRYRIISIDNKKLPFPFLKIVDTYTIIDVSNRAQAADKMLYIDVFPVDGLPMSQRAVETHYRIAKLYQHFLSISISKAWYATNLPKRIIKSLISNPVKLISPFTWAKLLDRHSRKYPFNENRNVGVVCWGYGKKECMPGGSWTKYVPVEFEGSVYFAPGCWDYYLRKLYGDYMQLPPEESRKTHNLVAFLDKK